MKESTKIYKVIDYFNEVTNTFVSIEQRPKELILFEGERKIFSSRNPSDVGGDEFNCKQALDFFKVYFEDKLCEEFEKMNFEYAMAVYLEIGEKFNWEFLEFFKLIQEKTRRYDRRKI